MPSETYASSHFAEALISSSALPKALNRRTSRTRTPSSRETKTRRDVIDSALDVEGLELVMNPLNIFKTGWDTEVIRSNGILTGRPARVRVVAAYVD